MSSSDQSGGPPRENQPLSAPVPAPSPVPAAVRAPVPAPAPVPAAIRVPIPVPAPAPAPSPVPAAVRAPVPAPAPAPVTLQAPVVGSDPTTAGAPEPVPVAASEPAPAPVAPVESEREPVVCYVPNEVDVSLRVLLALFVIGFGVWIVLTWLKYDKSAAQSEQGWHKGSRQMVELTLVKEDANKLACASNITVEGLNCAYDGKSQARVPPPPDDAHLLRPYCNVKNDVLLASGLWDSPGMRAPLPNERFTVVCNYDVVGVVKAVSLRWNPTDKFDPAKQSLPVGILTECVIPQ